MGNYFIKSAIAGVLITTQLSAPIAVGACGSIEECSQNIDSLKAEKEQAELELASADEQVASTEAKIEETMNEINLIQVEIDAHRESERIAESRINSMELEIAELEDSMVEKDELLKSRMVMMQLQRANNLFLNFLLNSESLNDFVSRSNTMQQLTVHEKELMTELQQSKERVIELKADAEAEKARVVQLRIASESAQSEQESLIARLKIEREAHAEQASRMRETIADLDLEASVAESQILILEAYYAEQERLEQERLEQEQSGQTGSGSIGIPSTSGFYRPTAGPVTLEYMSQEYPYSAERPHLGVDYGAYEGTPVVAVADGVVISASYGYNGGYGNMVVISHNVNGVPMVSIYGHLSSIGVNAGTVVTGGSYIGAVGNTGMSLGAHLHIEILSGISYMPSLRSERQQYTVNPLHYF